MKKDTFAKFFGISTSAAYNYFKETEERPIVKFVLKYLDENDVNEFIKNGKCTKLEQVRGRDEIIIDFFNIATLLGLSKPLAEFVKTTSKKQVDISKEEWLFWLANHYDFDQYIRAKEVFDQFSPYIFPYIFVQAQNDFAGFQTNLAIGTNSSFIKFLQHFKSIDINTSA